MIRYLRFTINYLFKLIFTIILYHKGYTSKDDISDDTRLILGNYRYDNNSKNTLQFFSVQVRLKKIQICLFKLI